VEGEEPQGRDFRLSTIGEAWEAIELENVARGEYVARVVTPPSGWKAFFVELAYPSPRPGLCQVYSTRVFVTPETRPFEGTTPDALVAAGRDAEPAASLRTASPRSAALLDGIFEDVGEGLHGRVLDEADDDLGERALRYCFARDVDDLDEAVELYARLGFDKSARGLLEDRLEDLWHDLRDGAEDLVDDVGDAVDDLF
jgi:hypothetical protein